MTAAAAPATGYAVSRFNAVQHGLLSKFTVLPWENPAEYEALLASLVAEHDPQGPTEAHLVEELAGVLWRKRRLRLAENACHHHALRAACANTSNSAAAALVLTGAPARKVDIASTLTGTAEEIRTEIRELSEDEAMTNRALERLETAAADSYEDALGLLPPTTHEAWIEQLAWQPKDYNEGETPYAATVEDLRRYLAEAILPWYGERRAELEAAPKVRLQALGESLDPDKLERLGRYEVHLDRKFERALSTLLRLQGLRRDGRDPREIRFAKNALLRPQSRHERERASPQRPKPSGTRHKLAAEVAGLLWAADYSVEVERHWWEDVG